MRERIIIKYGELWLKSEPVRRRFVKQLAENIRRMLKTDGIKFRMEVLRDMLVLDTGSRRAEEVLGRVFGISWFARAMETKSDFGSIEKEILRIGKEIKKNETFAIRASRSDKFLKFTSRQIEIETGRKIKRKVDLSNPDFTIFVEVKTKKAYVYSEKRRGLGGMPVGVSGRVLSLISGGIDSPVASWMLMKRGCSVDFVHFYSDQKGISKVRNLVKKLSEYSPAKLRLYAIPFREVLEEISNNCERRLTCVLCKRFMYKSSEMLAYRLGSKAIVTGDNLAQVASQTLDNIFANMDAVSIPILRPLVGMDKEENVSLAKSIGTYDLSVKDSSPCGFVPPKPSTMARIDSVLAEEGKIKDINSLLESIIENGKRFVI